MGNPGQPTAHGAVNAKILPEFRETREIQRLKTISPFPVQWRAAKGMPGLPTAEGRGCAGDPALLRVERLC